MCRISQIFILFLLFFSVYVHNLKLPVHFLNRYKSLPTDSVPHNSVWNRALCKVQGNFHLMKAADLQLSDVEKIGHGCHSPLMLFTTVSIAAQQNILQSLSLRWGQLSLTLCKHLMTKCTQETNCCQVWFLQLL